MVPDEASRGTHAERGAEHSALSAIVTQTRGMTSLPDRRWRWAVPGVVAAAIAATALASNSASAADPNLPARTAGQLLVALQAVQVPAFSGTIVQTSRLGFPELPGAAASKADLSLESFATGSRQLRIWQDGPERQRLALIGELAESDIVHNGADVWTYSSSTRVVTHLTLPPRSRKTDAPAATPALTPQQAANQALKAIDPTTSVSIDRTARVAGRAAYQIVLSPRDRRSLVGSVQIALDSETSIPLRVRVFARGGKSAALEVGFSRLTLRRPRSDVFTFVAPAGAKVEQRRLDSAPTTGERHPATPSSASTSPTVLGRGWTSVLVVKGGTQALSAMDAGSTGSNSGAGLLDRLTTRVAGGRLLSSALVTVFLRDDGTVFAGSLDRADLMKAASSGKGL